MLSSNTVRILYVQRTYYFALSTLKFLFCFLFQQQGNEYYVILMYVCEHEVNIAKISYKSVRLQIKYSEKKMFNQDEGKI